MLHPHPNNGLVLYYSEEKNSFAKCLDLKHNSGMKRKNNITLVSRQVYPGQGSQGLCEAQKG